MSTSRRRVLGHLAIGTGGLALGCGASAASVGDDRRSSRGPESEAHGPLARVVHDHQPRPLPFDPASLTGLSEGLIRSHHENNYAGAVRKLNECRERLASTGPDAPGFVWGGLAKSELTFSNSVLLHELYFENLGGEGGEPLEPVATAIAAAFGSPEGWATDFRRCAMSLAGGSGWVTLAYDAHRNQLAHRVCADHSHAGAFDMPLVVLDMYEHSYHMDHGTNAAEYVDAFLTNLRWDVVAARFRRAAPTT